MPTTREFYLARNTIIEMLKNRDYVVTQETFDSLDEFMSNYPTQQNLNFTVETKDKKYVSIYFATEEKVNKKAIELILSDHTIKGISHIIIILPSKLNHSSLAFINNSSLRVELFLYSEIQYNVLKHELVPKQTILQDVDGFLNKYKCTREDLPIMRKTDIVARFLGGMVDDVVEINRKSRTAGESLYYRVIK